MVLAGVVGSDLGENLISGAYLDPAAESQRAAALLAQEFPGGPPSLVLIAETPTGTVDSRMAEESGRELTPRLSEMPGVGGVHSYWASSNPWLHAANGRTALVALPTDLTRWLCLSCRAWAAFRPRPGMQPAGEGATFTRLHRRGCSPIRSEARCGRVARLHGSCQTAPPTSGPGHRLG